MPTETLEFEESLAPLLKEVDALSALPRTDARERELERLNQKLRAARTEIYGKLTPWQRVLVSRHPSRPDMLDYVDAALHRLRRAARRPPLRRRPRDRRRHGLLQGRAGDGGRPPQGRRHQAEDLSQLRLRAPRGLSQGHPADAHGRKIPPADRRLRRYAGGLPGRRIGRARRGRGDRVQPARDVGAEGAGRRRSSRARAAAAARSASRSAIAS